MRTMREGRGVRSGVGRAWLVVVLALPLPLAACSTVGRYLPPWGRQAEAPRTAPENEGGTVGRPGEVAGAPAVEPGSAQGPEDGAESGAGEQLVYGPQREPLTEAEQRQLASNLALAGALQDRDLDAFASRDGVVVTLPDVMFEFGSADLTDQARREIRDVADVLLGEGRGRRVEVGGHTDAIGAELYNVGLSERRAKAVARALISEGVSEALVTYKGYGSAHPIAPNSNPDGSDNPAGRALNRRVEIVIFN
jgi:outer membrane protein OmpA-like peptidoglycan-associated protein